MKVVTKNKRAYFDYEFSADYTAGIVLAWHEVKSIKTSHVNISDTIISIQNWELFNNLHASMHGERLFCTRIIYTVNYDNSVKKENCDDEQISNIIQEYTIIMDNVDKEKLQLMVFLHLECYLDVTILL